MANFYSIGVLVRFRSFVSVVRMEPRKRSASPPPPPPPSDHQSHSLPPPYQQHAPNPAVSINDNQRCKRTRATDSRWLRIRVAGESIKFPVSPQPDVRSSSSIFTSSSPHLSRRLAWHLRAPPPLKHHFHPQRNTKADLQASPLLLAAQSSVNFATHRRCSRLLVPRLRRRRIRYAGRSARSLLPKCKSHSMYIHHTQSTHG